MSLEKLKKDLVRLGRFGRKNEELIENFEDLDKDSGITRYSGSEADKKARDYIVQLMKEEGMEVKIDKVGNIFGIKEGSDPDLKSILVGSHIDTVTNGGMFDGALGVVSGIEAVRILKEEEFDNKRPIEVVVYTAEEGSSFPKSLLGSSFLIGDISVEEALETENEEGETLEEVLEKIGYKGDYEKDLDDVEYALEMHVEQGPVLYNENIPIGIVKKITGYTWLKAVIEGIENHAGTTPMNMRKDALLGASDIVKFVNKRASNVAEKGNGFTVGTVGKLSVFPNGINVIPRQVEMWIDVRDVIKKNIEVMLDEIIDKLGGLEKRYGLSVSTKIEFEYDPVCLSREVISSIRKSAEEAGFKYNMMNSGAGHDSHKIAEKIKTGMIFLPSVGGISHSFKEWTDWEDIEKGVKVLTETLKKLSNS